MIYKLVMSEDGRIIDCPPEVHVEKVLILGNIPPNVSFQFQDEPNKTYILTEPNKSLYEVTKNGYEKTSRRFNFDDLVSDIISSGNNSYSQGQYRKVKITNHFYRICGGGPPQYIETPHDVQVEIKKLFKHLDIGQKFKLRNDESSSCPELENIGYMIRDDGSNKIYTKLDYSNSRDFRFSDVDGNVYKTAAWTPVEEIK